MPFPTVKVLLEEKKAAFDAALATYLAGAGAAAKDAIRAVELENDQNPADNDSVWAAALVFGGADTPTATNKTADLQYLTVERDMDVGDAADEAALQTLIDDAIGDAVHQLAVVTDGVTTTPGVVSSVSNPFEAEDLGRKIQIGAEVRTIDDVAGVPGSVGYDNSAAEGGDFASGTGLSVDFLKAEVLQFMRISLHRTPQNKMRVHLLMAVEGELN